MKIVILVKCYVSHQTLKLFSRDIFKRCDNISK